MLKTFLLFAFLILALALPLTLLITSKTKSKMLYFFSGLCIYYLSTIMVNFFINAWQLHQLNSLQDKLIYMTTISLCIAFIIFIFFHKILKVMDKQKANAIYSGFAIANTCLYNLASYSSLLFISMNPTVDQLSHYYAGDAAIELIRYYDAISAIDLLLLIVEMMLTFGILYYLFIFVSKQRDTIISYVKLSAMLIVLYAIMYSGLPRLLGFAGYIVLLISLYLQEVSSVKCVKTGDQAG